MRLCRYDDDRLGVVIGDQVHDVTPAQDEIRRAARYDMFGDAVIAALPEWSGKIAEMAKKARRTRHIRSDALSGVMLANSSRSLPPQKCLPSPLSTTARTLSPS